MLVAHYLSLAGRLRDISLTLRPGEVTAICGPNGAGKSSLLTCLAGLLPPDSGTIVLDGIALADIAPRQRAQMISYLPQQGEVAWNLSVETLTSLGRLPWNSGAEADRVAIDAALDALDLNHLRQRSVAQLSGGELARVLLARVLAGEPRWILADEPLANLDLAHQLTLLRQFRRLAGQGAGVCLVLHDLAHAMNHADRVVVLDGGVLIAGTTLEWTETEASSEWLASRGERAMPLNFS